MIDFKKRAAELLHKALEIPFEEIEEMIEKPKNEMGDYAFPTFKFSKTYRKSPVKIAEEFLEKLETDEVFEKIEAKSGYVNFFVNRFLLIGETIRETFEKDEEFGNSDIGRGKNVVVEYSSTNIAKPFHIGHLRSTVIGDALYNIYKALGYNVIGINHLGDYGTQFGMLIAAYKLWGDRAEIEKDPINQFLELYVRFNKLQEEEPEKRELAREWFKKLEEGEEEAVELWKWMRDLSLKEFNRVYDMLGITFDSYAGEAFYSDKMPAVIDELHEKNLLKKDEGAEIADLEPYGLTPLIVIKSNGTTTYATRDMATAKYRKQTYDFYKCIYVVGSEQILHFKQWKKVMELAGYPWVEDCIHVNFGLISLEDASLSTRKGKVLFLEDVLNQAVEKTKRIIEERNPKLPNKEEVAKQVGIGAVKFQELFNQRIKDYVFSWDRTLSFDGETGPYTQYTYARISSLLDKGSFSKENEYDEKLLTLPEEAEIAKAVYNFPQVILDAQKSNEAFYVTRATVEIAKLFNKYYNSQPILVEDEKVKNARLALCHCVKVAIKKGLTLLGISCPERM